MSEAKCPDPATLKRLLLGRLRGDERLAWENHVSRCRDCADAADRLTLSDWLTDAIARCSVPQGDEKALQSVVRKGKALSALVNTVLTHDTEDVQNNSLLPSTSPGRKRLKFDFLAPARQPDELGRLGDHRILKVLGHGSMGIVFKAEDIHLQRRAALKVMRADMATKPEARERFLREARATAALSHDHIVQIYQVGEDRGVPFIAMQYLQGQSLQSAFANTGKLRPVDVARIGREVALGLAAAHEKGLIHRDINPDNIWIESRTRRAKILDFGLYRDLTSDAGLT